MPHPQPTVPEATLQRLSRYHCFVGELIRDTEGAAGPVTSRQMAEQLGVSEEAVRRDLSFVQVEGRRGAGYDPESLHEALGTFLGISDHAPFIVIGSSTMLRALNEIFPAEQFGMRPVACYSEREEDAGTVVSSLEVRPLDELSAAGQWPRETVALVACDPSRIDDALTALNASGLKSVLMLTPMLRPTHQTGMNVTYFRIPCAMKALASGTVVQSRCCGSHAP